MTITQVLLLLVAIAANATGAAMAAPQAIQLRRTGRVDGVSPSWAGVSLTLNAWWGAYAVATGQWIILPVAVISVVLYGTVVVYLLVLSGRATTARTLIAAAALSSLLPAAAAVLIGWGTVGVVLGALYGVQLTPAVVAAYRSTDVAGIAPATWQLAFVEAIFFGIYGVARSDFGLITLAVCGFVASTAILGRLLSAERARQASVAPPVWVGATTVG